MGEVFDVDIDKAQQLSEKLSTVMKAIQGFPPLPQPSGPLGSGGIERAWSDFEKAFATAKQNLAKSINKSTNGFAKLASGATQSDQEQAQQAATEIRTTT